jgi:hypothetical protein
MDDVQRRFTHPRLTKWLRGTKTSLTINTLKTAKPAYVGFTNQPAPDRSKVKCIEERFRNQINDWTTPIQVLVSVIFGEGKGNIAKV